MPKIMTAEQAFNVAMNLYPRLYSSTNVKFSKFMFFDHVFNVIGNGIRDDKEFLDAHTINKHNKNLIDSFPDKYINDEILATGYMKLKEIPGIDIPGFEFPDFDSRIDGLFTKEELNLINPKYISQYNKVNNFREPYPNFSKKYSLVWKINLDILDTSWLNAALTYYKQAQDFFNSEDVCNYSGAVPKDTEKLKKLIDDYESFFSDYKTKKRTQQDYFDAISKEYCVPYDGDTLKFIKKRWELQEEKIHQFLTKTINMLEKKLTNTKALDKTKISNKIIISKKIIRPYAGVSEPQVGMKGTVVKEDNTPANHTCIKFLATDLGYLYDPEYDDKDRKYVLIYIPNDNFTFIDPKPKSKKMKM